MRHSACCIASCLQQWGPVFHTQQAFYIGLGMRSRILFCLLPAHLSVAPMHARPLITSLALMPCAVPCLQRMGVREAEAVAHPPCQLDAVSGTTLSVAYHCDCVQGVGVVTLSFQCLFVCCGPVVLPEPFSCKTLPVPNRSWTYIQ